MLTSVC
ncbi:uncharacterized protein FFE2_16081 [Fusarium fujikuroi]|nr:uncharacterized protein FFE2_16081 [Fusarium fujikuroi]